MTNTYPTKNAMRCNKRVLPQVSPRGDVWHCARRGAIHTNHCFLYRGYLQIAVLALVYYNYRHYTPIDGRWLSRDAKISEK